MIKSRRRRWAGHVAYMGERKDVYRVLVGNLRERDHLEDPGIDDGTSGSGMLGVWAGSTWLRIETGGRHLRMQK